MIDILEKIQQELQEDFVRPKTACKLFGVSETTLNRWINEGRINSYYPDGQHMFGKQVKYVSRDEIRELIRSGKAKNTIEEFQTK